MYSDAQPVRIGRIAWEGSDDAVLLARLVDRILRGASPADLPAEQPTRLDLIINLRTARAMGFELPAAFVAQATEVIR